MKLTWLSGVICDKFVSKTGFEASSSEADLKAVTINLFRRQPNFDKTTEMV